MVQGPTHEGPERDEAPRWTNAVIQRALVRYAADPAVTLDERLSAGRWIADPASLRTSCRQLLPEAEGLPPFKGSYSQRSGVYESEWTREETIARLVVRWVLANRYASDLGKPRDESDVLGNQYEDASSLKREPELLGPLSECMRSDAAMPAVLEVLRDALGRTRSRSSALDLLRRLGAEGAPLTDEVFELHAKTQGDTKWDCVSALMEMGPVAVARIQPWLESMKGDSSEGWIAGRFLEDSPKVDNSTVPSAVRSSQ
jgi:hypothetical protein